MPTLLPSTLVAQMPARAWGVGEFLIAIVVIAACIGILYVALRVFGVQVPQWFVQICLIIVVAVVAIMAIRFLLSL